MWGRRANRHFPDSTSALTFALTSLHKRKDTCDCTKDSMPQGMPATARSTVLRARGIFASTICAAHPASSPASCNAFCLLPTPAKGFKRWGVSTRISS
eukprot:2903994-Amphidinium_carterae.1